MGLFVYNLITQAYFLGIKLAANWNEKAKQWVKGREGLFEKLTQEIFAKRVDNQRLVWMHCASLGEFEQGRTVIEALKKKHPELLILLSFFSPSGFEIRKNYEYADWVIYLPSDSKSNAERFLDLVKPDMAIFVKYEFWYHFLHQLQKRNIPSLLIAGIFRRPQPFFRWYGNLHRSMLRCFTHLFVQDSNSKNLLLGIGITEVTTAGDNRVDRVVEIGKYPIELPLVKAFCGDAQVLVCGSTWPADEAILYPIFKSQTFKNWKFILAPHDVQLAHIQEIISKLPITFQCFSEITENAHHDSRLLLIDNIGLLSSLYQFGEIAYIGGGFDKGIHNTLEPAAFGLPVIFGPKYHKFVEAKNLIMDGGAFTVKSSKEFNVVLKKLANTNENKIASEAVKEYMLRHAGSTEIVIKCVQEIVFERDREFPTILSKN